MAFLAELVNHIGQRPLVHRANRLGRRCSRRRVHPHIERIVTPKAETASRRVELHGRDAEVGEHAVDGSDPSHIELVRESPIVAMNQLGPITVLGQRRARVCERRRIAIEPDHPRRASFHECAGVASETNRAIDEHAAPRGLEVFEHLRDHHGLVHGAKCSLQIPCSARRNPSSSIHGSRCSFWPKRSLFQTSR